MKKKQGAAIVWFRNDLRLEDNPALAAASEFEQVIPVFSLSAVQMKDWQLGGASKWWLHHSLRSLSEDLRQKKMPLFLVEDEIEVHLQKWIKEHPIKAIFWNRRYEPDLVKRDAAFKEFCGKNEIITGSFSANLLAEPWVVLKSDKTPYQVYTAYWNAFLKAVKVRNVVNAESIDCKVDGLSGACSLESFNLLPKIKWDAEFYKNWKPGEANALAEWKSFGGSRLKAYNSQRNIPSEPGTSRVSAYLHFGELSVVQIWKSIEKKYGPIAKVKDENVIQYCKELVWREFSTYLLFHFPKLDLHPLRSEFANFAWRDDKESLRAWQTGQTGYPIVDAGMRELWTTGWMHNRVRMVVASFLVKDLLVPWQDGARWFWDTLVDADLGNNTQGWQWTSGCGADAAPYFRIFNPTLQSQKFDADGDYIRRWVPELKRLHKKWIHDPESAPAEVLAEAGVVLGKTYPEKIVQHEGAKVRALNAFKKLKK